MRVRKIRADGFTSWRGARPLELDLPERGVFLITGPNGAGKSSIVEAVAFAVWGRTLRGSPPWRDGAALSVSVVLADGLEVERTVSARGKKDLRFRRGPSGEWSSHPTTTKAQDELEQIVGGFDAWRRTSVFSSSDVDALTRATDAERKRLLEHIVGIARFDEALAEVRAELAEATRAAESAASKLAERRRVAAEIRARIGEIDRAGSVPDDGSWWWRWVAARRRASAIAAEVAGHRERLSALEAAGNQARDARVRAEAAAATSEERKRRLAAGACPTCGQELRGELVVEVEAAARDAAAMAAIARSAEQLAIGEHVLVRGSVRAAAERLAKEEAEVRLCHGRMLSVDREEAEAEGRASRRASAEAELLRIEAEIESLSSSKTAGDLERLRSLERVFGLRGARATLVAGVAAAVGEGARARIERLLPGTSLRSGLTPKGELSIAVVGAGGGHGYDAASQGERRRIDVPLLLSLSEVAASVRGEEPGALWLDEAMDSLDRGGVDGVVEIVEEVATSRLVVLISHRADLVEGLKGVAAGRLDVG